MMSGKLLDRSHCLTNSKQVQGRTFFRGQQLAFKAHTAPRSADRIQISAAAAAPAPTSEEPRELKPWPLDERLRLSNLAPQPGSRRKNLRKGRGYGAGQGGPCGFGMRGQNARSGPGTRPGFEGGQMPLYRRLPKLKGIAGGMGAGLPKFVTVNLRQLEAKFKEGDEVSLESVLEKKLFKATGRDSKLPLKILGDGELKFPLTIKATSFSTSAREKIEKAGGSIVEVPAKIKWTRQIGKERKAAAAAAAPPKAAAAKKEKK